MNKVQIAIITFSIIIAIAAIIAFSLTGEPEPPIRVEGGQLIVWGIDRADIFEGVFSSYKGELPVKIIYVEKDPRTFERELLEALASQNPPDLLIATDDWIRENHNKIAPPAREIINVDVEKRNMVELASSLFIDEETVDGKVQKTIWALPLWLDPLVLYWNKDIFEQTAPKPIARPPEDWDTLVQFSKRIAVIGEGKKVALAGAALGRAKNIPLYKEILSLLLLQLDTDIESGIYSGSQKEKSELARSAIQFYTDFGNPNTAPGGAYTWDPRLAEPRELFAEGKLGMMVDLYSFASELRAKNPHLAFDIAPVPQARGGKRVNYAKVMAVTVPKTAKSPPASWFFAKWLTSMEQVEIIMRSHNITPTGRDLLESGKIGVFLKSASITARRPRETYPAENSRILKDLIESVANGKMTASAAMAEASKAYNLFVKSKSAP